MIDIRVDASQARTANNSRIKNLSSGTGVFARAISEAADEFRKEAGPMTHVDTGALRSSHRNRFESTGGVHTGIVSPDAAVINPRTKRSVSTYAIHEHRRGGDHAFYDRTVAAYKGRIVGTAVRKIAKGIL